MTDVDRIMNLVWELCRAAEETSRMNCDREEDAVIEAIEQALSARVPAKTPVRVWGWVWKHKRYEDGCGYVPSYTPAQHVPKGELLALVDAADLDSPLENTQWYNPTSGPAPRP